MEASYETCRNRIINLLDKGKIDECVRVLEEFALHNSFFKEDAITRFNRECNYPGVVERIKQAEKSDSEHASFLKKGISCLKLCKPYEALLNYKKVVELDSKCTVAYFFINSIYCIPEGDGIIDSVDSSKYKWLSDLIKQNYDIIINSDPTFGEAYYHRSIIQECIDDEISDREKAAELSTGKFRSEICYWSGWTLFTRGVFEKSKKFFKEAYRHDPRIRKDKTLDKRYKGIIFFISGLIEFQNKKFSDAILNFSKASKYYSECGESYDANALSLLAKYVPLDVKFEKVIKESRDLSVLKNDLKEVVDDIIELKNFYLSRGVGGFGYELFETKSKAIITLYDILNIGARTDKDILNRLNSTREFFRYHGFENVIKSLNDIENFFIELKKYDDLSAIPKDKEMEILTELRPICFLNGELTRDIIRSYMTEAMSSLGELSIIKGDLEKIRTTQTEIRDDILRPGNIDEIIKQLKGPQKIAKRRILCCFKDEKEMQTHDVRNKIANLFEREYERETISKNLSHLSKEELDILRRKGRGSNTRYELTDLGKEVTTAILRKKSNGYRGFRV